MRRKRGDEEGGKDVGSEHLSLGSVVGGEVPRLVDTWNGGEEVPLEKTIATIDKAKPRGGWLLQASCERG